MNVLKGFSVIEGNVFHNSIRKTKRTLIEYKYTVLPSVFIWHTREPNTIVNKQARIMITCFMWPNVRDSSVNSSTFSNRNIYKG